MEPKQISSSLVSLDKKKMEVKVKEQQFLIFLVFFHAGYWEKSTKTTKKIISSCVV